MRSLNFFISLFLFISTSSIAEKIPAAVESANAAYSAGHFEKAAKLYESALDNSESAELYFNLGNAYYKQNMIGLAVLNYERAKKLDPDDEDININLKHAYQKTEDKIDAAPELFLTEWKNGLVNMMSEKQWSVLCIVLVCVSLLLFLLYFLGNAKRTRQSGFFGGSILLILTICVFFIAKHRYSLDLNSSGAVITDESVTVTGSPSENGTKLFILHEGTKVEIIDEQPNWVEIRIANGNTGWLKVTKLERI